MISLQFQNTNKLSKEIVSKDVIKHLEFITIKDNVLLSLFSMKAEPSYTL